MTMFSDLFEKMGNLGSGEYTSELGEGFYYTYDEKPNGCGGYHDVNITLRRRDEPLFRVRITDGSGTFVRFPGVVEGKWRDDLTRPFRPRCDFRNGIEGFKDGRARFYWMVQPDGRYWGDDGFGMEPDVEIVLVAELDEKGRFTGPFEKKAKP